MKVIYHRNFLRKYKKCSEKTKIKFKEKLVVFKEDKTNSVLNNHNLRGELKDIRSINITGDYRALYKSIGNEVFEFVDIDTHSNLYK